MMGARCCAEMLLSLAVVAVVASQLPPKLGEAVPVWSANATAQFVLLRRPFRFPARDKASTVASILHITAQPIPNRLAGPRHGGSLASKLLCAYKVWINDIPIGVGPGRPTGMNSTRESPALLFDSFNVSAYLHKNSSRQNILAIESFYWTAEQEAFQVGCPPGESAICLDGRSTDLDPTNPRDMGGVLAWLDDGNGGPPFLRTGDAGWSVWADGDRALSVNHGVTNGQYHQPHEFYDMRFYPDSQWRSDSRLSRSGWVAPRTAPPFQRLSSKGIAGIRMETVSAASFRRISPDCYVIDFGAIIQGGLCVTFVRGQAGQRVTVFAGEVLYADGSVKWWEDFLNDTNYRAVWTLRNGKQTIMPHEFKEARYWQICGAPEPPTHANLRGWRVWYPMGTADEQKVGQVVPAVPEMYDPAVFTFVKTSDENLNSVWGLCRYTLRVAALDVNTDSNTRQRDPCNWDSHLQALGQAAIAPVASTPYRWRSLSFLFEPDAQVMVWTEFFLFTLFATYAYTFESADLSVANKFFDRLAAQNSCGQFITPMGVGGGSLVVKDPGQTSGVCKYGNISTGACHYKDLIDWPNNLDSLVASSSPDAACCRDGFVMNRANAPINAHVWAAQQQLSWLAAAIGRPAVEARRYAVTAAALKEGVVSLLARPASACHPQVGPCFADGLNQSHTSMHSTMFILGQQLLTPAEAQPYLPFLKAKSTPFPRCSAALSHFLFEAFYTIAQGQSDSNEAADFAFELMARDGHRSWREMIAVNATMTLEHWYGVNFKKHTVSHMADCCVCPHFIGSRPDIVRAQWSHPWAAAPAAVIVRRLFGVRPLDIGYRSVSIHPQPPRHLSNASTTVPTPRGVVAIDFQQSAQSGLVLTHVKVPKEMVAEVCLPTALLLRRATSVLVVNGKDVVSVLRHRGQLCVAEKLGGGSYNVRAR